MPEWPGRELRRFARPLYGTPDDYDALLSRIGDRRFVLIGEASHGTEEFYRYRVHTGETDRLSKELPERAIGVIYRPETERISHYFHARIGEQFDAVLHLDVTSALKPLDAVSESPAEIPETIPSGL